MKQPLWMPRGSVRALLALSLTGALIYAALFRPEVAAPLVAAVTMVVRDYFENRKDKDVVPPKA